MAPRVLKVRHHPLAAVNALIATLPPEFWSLWLSPGLLNRCLVAIMLFGLVAAFIDSGEPEDPTDF